MIRTLNLLQRIVLFFLIISLWTRVPCSAQSNVVNKYGLTVMGDISDFNNSIYSDSNKRMINILNCLPEVILDLRYATTNNFMHQKLYPTIRTTYLRSAAAIALEKVLKELTKENLTLKIFDAYRPYSVTQKMWEACKR